MDTIKYYFYYYMQFHHVACAKVAYEHGQPIGGEIHAVPGNIHEISYHEFHNWSLFDLKGKYEYQDKDEDNG